MMYRSAKALASIMLMLVTTVAFVAHTQTANATPSVTAGAVRTALAQQGFPYQYGGSPSAWTLKSAQATKCAKTGTCRFDCSSLVQYSFERNGLYVPRTTGEQWKAGKKIPLSKAQVGDLVFFSDKNKTVAGITHVGILVGNSQMVEAPRAGKNVRVTTYKDRPGLMPYVVRLA